MKEKIEAAKEAVEVIKDASDSFNKNRSGWAVILIIVGVIVFGGLVYKIARMDSLQTINVLSRELEVCKNEKIKMENYFIYKVNQLNQTMVEADSTVRTDTEPSLKKIDK